MSTSKAKPAAEFAAKIEHEFSDLKLLETALTHRSFLNEQHTTEVKHNERLEFLGDAVLELVVTQYLFENYPKRPEGDLTSFRAALVKTPSLADTALELEMGEYIRMSKGEEATGGRTRPYILANTFEAILGALYLDAGFEKCQEFVKQNLLVKLEDIVEYRLDIDPKSKLQEFAQEKFKYTPNYQLVSETGPDHEKVFTMEVIIEDKPIATGEGNSKQEAEQTAAEAALKLLLQQ